jgi:Flp pilus assembly protein TadD
VLQDALAHHQAGRLEEAEALYRAVLAAEPRNADALHLLGVAAQQQGRPAEAVALIGRALEIVPGFGPAHANLGNALLVLGRMEEAAQSFRRAADLDPGNADVRNNLGVALNALHRSAEAEAACREAIALNPDLGQAHSNLTLALIRQDRMKEAEQSARRAVALLPGDAEAHNFLAIALVGLERFDEAARSYRQALALKPDYAEAHLNFGQLCLMSGDYAEGWQHYRYRRALPGPTEWTGTQDLRGKSILLQYEQGLGDTIHFCRYALLVAAKGAKVFLHVPPVLAPFMQDLGVEVVTDGMPAPRTDYTSPLLSLPAALGTTVETIPAKIPYLRADPGDWRAKLGAGKEKLVGLCWRGNPAYPGDKTRSTRFATVAPLLEITGIRFVSLQKEQHADERHPKLLHPGADFAGTAGLIAALDLVISVDTVWAHMAGALGKPVWLLLPRIPHWCWMRGREDSPWYPSARLFRQDSAGDWAPVIARIGKNLRM